jgi:nucleoside phosphorylase
VNAQAASSDFGKNKDHFTLRSRTGRTKQAHAIKHWLVLAAWPPELAELRRLLKRRLTSRQVVARAAGVGLVEAAIGATAAIAQVKPAAVMFVGTAGLYPNRRPDLALAGAVAARRLVLSADGTATGDAYLPSALPATQETTVALRRIAAATGLLMADVACPLAITSRQAAVGRRPRAPACDVENLEAFAVARAAAASGLPFAAILGISNSVGPSAHAAWKRNAARAAAAACRAALEVIERSTSQPASREPRIKVSCFSQRHRGHRV